MSQLFQMQQSLQWLLCFICTNVNKSCFNYSTCPSYRNHIGHTHEWSVKVIWAYWQWSQLHFLRNRLNTLRMHRHIPLNWIAYTSIHHLTILYTLFPHGHGIYSMEALIHLFPCIPKHIQRKDTYINVSLLRSLSHTQAYIFYHWLSL